MKFSHSLQFNAVPEWASKYIAYTSLKKLIYTLQRESLRKGRDDDLESSHLMSADYGTSIEHTKDPSHVFLFALDAELKKMDDFYKNQEDYLTKTLEDLLLDIESFEKEVNAESRKRNPSDLNNFQLEVSNTKSNDSQNLSNVGITDGNESQGDIHDGEDAQQSDAIDQIRNEMTKTIDDYLRSPKSPAIWSNLDASASSLPPRLLLLSENRVILRKRIINLFTSLSELRSYVQLNHTGFKKALKKFDKSLHTQLKDEYLETLSEKSYIFRPKTISNLEENINSLVKLYALITNQSNDLEVAKSELSIHLREHVVWERNTVWRDMIGLERKTYAANSKMNVQEDNDSSEKSKHTVMNTFNLSFKNPTVIKLFLILVFTLILLNFSPFQDETQKNCFALLVASSLLWATEVIPLFVTSLIIPLVIVVLRVLKNDDGSVMNAPESSRYILSTMWNSVILLLLGGFTLAAALSKYHIAKLISTAILSRAGTSPPFVLLTIMGIALFASMWVSNVAAPVLCFSLIQPLLRTLPKGTEFTNALILGIALASNIGGMASPIASPQNIIAIGSMEPQPSWGQWFVVALPVCVLALLFIWLFLLLTFNCTSNVQIVKIRTIDEKLTGVQWYIIGVSIFTILLWCLASKLESIFGEMGIIALIPLILFFGPGLLNTEDINNYPWNIILLAMGGTALGKAVASSGLLSTIAIKIQEEVRDFSLFGVTVAFGVLILIVATFVSHTVAALIIIPLVAEVGNDMPEPHPRLLILASALLCSAAMGLPTSGFPNVTAICMTDEFGKPYLTVGTFITRGVPSSLIAYFIIITVGFATMKIINF